MTEQTPTSGVCLEAALPLGWSVGQATSPDLRHHANIALLRALAAIESPAPEREHDLPEGVQKSLEHLESKLEMVLFLVAGLARAGVDLPSEKPVTLFSDHIFWVETTGNAPQPGQRLQISLYLSPRLPQALQMAAVVTKVDEQQGKFLISARFEGVDEELDDWLTRTVFRYHRRALQARRQP